MEEIIPRWEWRTFAPEVKVRLDLDSYPKDRHVQSSEVYVLSTVVDENPKFREEKMDVKSLIQVNEDGLEQWKPIFKIKFPLTRAQMAEVYGIFRLTPPEPRGESCTFAEFLESAKKNRRLMVISVDKERDLYNVDGCTVEAATVKVDGRKYQTVAVEDPDPAKVKKTVSKLGLWGQENINYVQGLKRIRNKQI